MFVCIHTHSLKLWLLILSLKCRYTLSLRILQNIDLPKIKQLMQKKKKRTIARGLFWDVSPLGHISIADGR